jgi:putative cell wall-binding protein
MNRIASEWRMPARGALAIAAVLVLTLMAPLGARAATVSETEPNSTSAQAQTVVLGTTINGRFGPSADCDNVFYDCDYFKITAPQAGRLIVDLRFSSSLGTSGSIGFSVLNASGATTHSRDVAVTEYDGSMLRSQLITVAAGVNYVFLKARVDGFGSSYVLANQPYTLTISHQALTVETEPNGKTGTADPIAFGKPVTGAAFNGDCDNNFYDCDFYRFTLASAQQVTVDFRVSCDLGTDRKYEITVLDNTGHEVTSADVGSAECSGAGLRAQAVSLPAGNAYIGVSMRARTAAEGVAYTLAIYPPATRIAGADRYATSAQISKVGFASGVPVVYVANGANFPDALSGAPVAALRGGPVLLTSSTSLPAVTITELQRLNPESIVVLGGTSAVSAAVERQLRDFSPQVSRIAGGNRYDTSARISASYFDPNVPVVFVAAGGNFPDALSGAPAAAAGRGPVLLSAANGLPVEIKAELARLKPQKIVLLGGTGSLGATVLNQLKSYAPSVVRYAGDSRFDTAAVVSKQTFAPGVAAVYIASGSGFPDALSGAPLAGRRPAPILLTGRDALSPSVMTELERLRPHSIIVLGGPGAVSDAVKQQLSIYIRP